MRGRNGLAPEIHHSPFNIEHSTFVPLFALALTVLLAGSASAQQSEPSRSGASPPQAAATPSLTTPPKPSPDAIPRWDENSYPAYWDWIQLTTSEWLKGRFLGLYDRKLEFDSDKFNRVTFEWSDVRQVHTAGAMEVGLTDGAIAVGRLVIVGDKGTVFGERSIALTRDHIQTITPWGGSSYSFRRWTGKVDLGATVQRGNTDQLDTNLKANLKYRTARDRVVLDSIANFAHSNGTDTADNSRTSVDWDHFLKNRWFVKPAGLEEYRDPFQNIAGRTTAGVGAGYQILDTKRTEWQVSAGIGYQNTRYTQTSEEGSDSSDTGAIGASTHFKREITKAVDFTYDYKFQFTTPSSGRYNHHMVAFIETDWTRTLSFDVTLVWDRTQLPQADASGVVPDKDDVRMIVSLGIEF